MNYWTVVIPYVPQVFQTEWHPTEQSGPFSILTRGCFVTESEAIMWGREHLRGTPYSTKKIEDL